MKKILYILLSVMLITACQTKHRGYVFPNDIKTVVSNVKTTHDLQTVLGDPQTKTVYGNNIWIYYGADENINGPLPQTYSNKTVVLAWVQGDKVLKTRVLQDKELKDIYIASGETEIPAAIELYAVEELFNNIGRFSPAGMGQ
ncbi:MAG: hypothetical protein MJ158_04280 [Alphaproteobacteria bacterium]|nr:hypothetical protein [Alphaproteobacteria bacterium]